MFAICNNYNLTSNMFADADDVNNIVDVCGDAQPDNKPTMSRRLGFIETPNYPKNYPPGIKCQCHMESADNHASIQFKVSKAVLGIAPDLLVTEEYCS